MVQDLDYEASRGYRWNLELMYLKRADISILFCLSCTIKLWWVHCTLFLNHSKVSVFQ